VADGERVGVLGEHEIGVRGRHRRESSSRAPERDLKGGSPSDGGERRNSTGTRAAPASGMIPT
jgi:hypothetical protein